MPLASLLKPIFVVTDDPTTVDEERRGELPAVVRIAGSFAVVVVLACPDLAAAVHYLRRAGDGHAALCSEGGAALQLAQAIAAGARSWDTS